MICIVAHLSRTTPTDPLRSLRRPHDHESLRTPSQIQYHLHSNQWQAHQDIMDTSQTILHPRRLLSISHGTRSSGRTHVRLAAITNIRTESEQKCIWRGYTLRLSHSTSGHCQCIWYASSTFPGHEKWGYYSYSYDWWVLYMNGYYRSHHWENVA